MATRNYIIALVMGLLALVQAVSGFVLWLALPSGGRGTFLWSRGVWLNMHSRSAIVLMILVIVHVILHWGWIVSMTKSCVGRK